jgi:hypothetical protein
MNASVDNPRLGVDLQTDTRTPLTSTYDFETSPPGRQQRQLIRKSLRAITPAALNKRTIRTPEHVALSANLVIKPPPVTEYCFHGTAVNPDTGTIAGYKELLTCSTASLWDTANGLEIG